MNACQRLLCLGLALYSAGATAACGNDTPTSASTTPTTTTTTTPAEASVTEEFTGTVAVNGSRFYAFEVGTFGTVTVTLDRAGGSGVPSTVSVGLGIGVPEATDCRTTISLDTEPGSGPHISTTLGAGIYCARVYDIGTLAAPTAFAITIAHP